jgi:hypothetical protein
MTRKKKQKRKSPDVNKVQHQKKNNNLPLVIKSIPIQEKSLIRIKYRYTVVANYFAFFVNVIKKSVSQQPADRDESWNF